MNYAQKLALDGCICALILAPALGLAIPKACRAAEQRSDRHALHAIFGDVNLEDNVHSVRERAAALSLDARFRWLADWVLPSADHPNLRLTAAFTPANPAPVDHAVERRAAELQYAVPERSRAGLWIGGSLVSPASDLVDVARQLGCLNQLRTRVERLRPTVDETAQQRAHASLLILIAIAQDDAATARREFERLYDLFRDGGHVQVETRWPETVALTRGLNYEPTRKIVGEFLYMIYRMYVGNTHGWRDSGSPSWDRHFFWLLGGHKALQAGSGSVGGSVSRLTQWSAASRMTARTRGVGLPSPRWDRGDRSVVKLGGHDEDYLYFQSPLRGDFAVECDLTTAGWQDLDLSIAGTWVRTSGDSSFCETGNFREPIGRVPLTPALAGRNEWSRYRVVVHEGICSTYLNGRKIHDRSIQGRDAIWLAIHAEACSHGSLRDLRITGSPSIPEQIDLARQPELPGWLPYFDETVGPNGDWQYVCHTASAGELVGIRKPELAGTHTESLLRYHRPMLEDGAVEYEFLYVPGTAMVHPALDRLVFLVEPRGVAAHWITDGKYDRTGLDPANRSTEPENRLGPLPLPLKPQAWNHLRLSVQGDELQLELNGQPIYRRELEPTNLRTFGLFHYSDRTEARVRKLSWRGSWSLELPPLAEQELARPDPDCLVGLEDLREVWVHTFADRASTLQRFSVNGRNWQRSLLPRSDGLQLSIGDAIDPHTIWIGDRRPIYGDFDATLRFEQCDPVPGPAGNTGIEFNARDDSDVHVACGKAYFADGRRRCAARKRVPLPDGSRRQTEFFITDESREGMLRLVRRGDAMHMLIAHGDSPHFQLVGSHTLPSAGSAVELQFVASTAPQGSLDVLLKDLTVRSNTHAVQERVDRRVQALSEHTATFPERLRRNFSAGTHDFRSTGTIRPVPTDAGLQIRADARVPSGRAELTFQRPIAGEFDLSVSLGPTGLPEADGAASPAELSVALSTDEGKQARLVVRRKGDQYQIAAEVARTRRSAGTQREAIAVADAISVDQLRLIRVQRTLFFLHSGAGTERVLGQWDLGTQDIPAGGVELGVVLPPVQNASSGVLWKLFDLKTSLANRP